MSSCSSTSGSSHQPRFESIFPEKFPTMPLPWTGDDDGELWVWHDYFMTLQHSPKTILDLASSEEFGDEIDKPNYLYALTVFYRDAATQQTHTDPILIFCLEQDSLALSVFTSRLKANHGTLTHELTLDNVRSTLLSLMAQYINREDQPTRIGIIADAFTSSEIGIKMERLNTEKPTTQRRISFKSLKKWLHMG